MRDENCNRSSKRLMSEGVLLTDIEGVLLDAEFLPALAEEKGRAERVQEITEKGRKGEISWEEGLRKRIEILEGIDYEDAVEIAREMPYMKGAKEFCDELRGRNFSLIGVTGGFKVFSEKVKDDLGLDEMISNELRFKDRKMRGVKKMRVKREEVEGLEKLLEEEKAEEKEIVAIADGANDLVLFDQADKTIAFNAVPIIEEHADIVVESEDLRRALRFI